MTKLLVSTAQHLWISDDDCSAEDEPEGLEVSPIERFWIFVENSSVEKINGIIEKYSGSKVTAALYDIKGFGKKEDYRMPDEELGTIQDILADEPGRIPPRIVAIQMERELGSTKEETRRLLINRLYGRILAKPFGAFSAGACIDHDAARQIAEILQSQGGAASVRSPLTCKTYRGICRRCYGLPVSAGKYMKSWGISDLAPINTRVGIIAAQAVGEPATQMALRKKHVSTMNKNNGADIISGIEEAKKCFESNSPLLLGRRRGCRDTADHLYRQHEITVAPVHFEVIFKGVAYYMSDQRRKRMENPNAILSDAEFSPYATGGCTVTKIKDWGLFDRWNFIDGDVYSVNGRETNTIEELTWAFRVARSANELEFKYARNGKNKKVTYSLSGEAGWVSAAACPDRLFDLEESTGRIIAIAALYNEQDYLGGLKEHALLGGSLPFAERGGTI